MSVMLGISGEVLRQSGDLYLSQERMSLCDSQATIVLSRDEEGGDDLYEEITQAILNQDFYTLERLMQEGDVDLRMRGSFDESPAWQTFLNWTFLSDDALKILDCLNDVLKWSNDQNSEDNFLLTSEIIKKALDNQNDGLATTLKILNILVLEYGLDLNAVDDEGNAALHYLCSQSSKHYLSVLTECIILGANVSQQNIKGQIPLHCYLQQIPYEEDSMEILLHLSSVQDLNVCDSKGKSALAYAFESLIRIQTPLQIHSRFQQIDYLISLGADINIPSVILQESPLHYFIRYDQFSLLDKNFHLLKELNTPSKITLETPLIELIKKMDQPDLHPLLHCLKILLEKIKNLNLDLNPIVHGYTPWQWALKLDQSDVAEMLAKAGFKKDVWTYEGLTILHLVWDASLQIFEYALKELYVINPSLIDYQDAEGVTILHQLSMSHRLQHIQMLIEKGVNASITDKKGQKPLDYAISKMDLSVARLYIKNCSEEDFALRVLGDLKCIESMCLYEQWADLYHLIYKAFLNSELNDVQYFVKGIMGYSKKLLQGFPKEFEKIQNQLARICGGFFTWGALIARFPTDDKQRKMQRMYGDKNKPEDLEEFIAQQIEFGNKMFSTVLRALQKFEAAEIDFYKIYNLFAESNCQVRQERKNSNWEDFQIWRGGKELPPQEEFPGIFTRIGNLMHPHASRYEVFIAKCRRIFTLAQKGVKGIHLKKHSFFAGYYLTCSSEKQEIPLTQILFKKAYMENECLKAVKIQVRDYIWLHTQPRHLQELLKLIETNHRNLKEFYQEEVFIKTAWLLAHAAPFNRGSAQCCLNWMMLIKLHFNHMLPPIKLEFAQLDCHLISETYEMSLTNFSKYFEPFKYKLQNFRHLNDVEQQKEEIEIQWGRQFLGLN